MLSSLTNSPQFPPQVDLNSFFSYDPQPEQDYLSVMDNAPPLELTKKFSNESSTSASKGLNTPSSQPKVIEKNNTNPQAVTPFQNPENKPETSQPINTKRNDSFLNQSETDHLNVLTKKIKTEKPTKLTAYDSLVHGFQILETYNSYDIFEDDQDLTKTDRQVKELEKLLQSGGSCPWNSLKSTQKEIDKESELSKALDLIKDLKIPKHENPKDSSYEFSATFEIPASLMKPEEEPPVMEEEEELVKGIDDGIELARNLSVQSNTSQHDEKAFQAIKASLDAIHDADFDRLEPEVYLNDNLINFYLKFIENVLAKEDIRKRCHFFNTYFMAKMLKLFNDCKKDPLYFNNIYDEMKKWTKRINIFEKDFIFLPVNNNEHWDLIVVCYPHRLFSQDNELPFILYLDSLCRMDSSLYSSMLYQFFTRELKAKMPEQFKSVFLTKSFRVSLTTFPHYQYMTPRQSNLSDCGLYLIQYIEMFVNDHNLLVDQKEEMDKTRWFPRKLIEEKRQDIGKLIRDLKANRIEAIDEYLNKRSELIERYSNEESEYNGFNQEGFEKALIKTHPGRTFNEVDQKCLMLDFYFFNTLDYDEVAKAAKK